MFDLIWLVLAVAGLFAIYLVIRRIGGYDDSQKINDNIDLIRNRYSENKGTFARLWDALKRLLGR